MGARIRISPAKQGHLDGACGFYAITNAIHILEPDLEPSEIFRATWQHFLRDGNPLRMIDGTTRGSIKNILSRTISEINENYMLTDRFGKPYLFNFEIPYWNKEKERNREQVLSTLRPVSHREGCVAIIGYRYARGKNGDDYDHWTVIRESDADGIVTHDSSGEKKKILFSEMRIDSFAQQSHSTRPYNVYSSDIFVIRAAPISEAN